MKIDQLIQKSLFSDKSIVNVKALFIGERIDLRALELGDRLLATLPLIVTAGEQGCAVLFRYGVVVLFDLSPKEQDSFLADIDPLISDRFSQPKTEAVELNIDPTLSERVENKAILLPEFSLECLQVVADVLAKSVVLDHYEASIAKVFDQIEPLASGLRQKARSKPQGKELLRHIGGTLLIQQKMVGLVEIPEKPQILWERPELERFHVRLAKEYELSERHLALERKLELISRTAETVLELLQHNSNLRVEWYIVVLIVVEILLTSYEIFSRA
jgi:uncharacterized Rmd1/YagE family protein